MFLVQHGLCLSPSVFCGAADKNAYEEVSLIPRTKTHHHNYTVREKHYQEMFQVVRNCREQHDKYSQLPEVWNQLKSNFADDWLCSLDILEVLNNKNLHTATAKEIKDFLERKASLHPEYKKLITDGLYLIEHPVVEAAAT